MIRMKHSNCVIPVLYEKSIQAAVRGRDGGREEARLQRLNINSLAQLLNRIRGAATMSGMDVSAFEMMTG